MIKAFLTFAVGALVSAAALHLSVNGILNGALVALVVGGMLMFSSLFMVAK